MLTNYVSNDSFLLSARKGYYEYQGKNERLADLTALSQEELSSRRLQERSEALTKFKVAAQNHLLDSFLWFFVAGLFFIVHWSWYRRLERR